MVTKATGGDKAVLFVLIGWTEKYNGSETPKGGHERLKGKPKNTGEAKAFKKVGGLYRCGIGVGNVMETNLDIVFVARNLKNQQYQVVGVYRNSKVNVNSDNWGTASSKSVVFYPTAKRPVLTGWQQGRSMRRWAHRVAKKAGNVHKPLLTVYMRLIKNKSTPVTTSQEQQEMAAFEGKLRQQFIKHRSREAKKRQEKIDQTLKDKGGKLRCEVPGCGFDFQKVYGKLGKGFAVVHHLFPLARGDDDGRETLLKDLAVVCGNCHLMIHRKGKCRRLETLIKKPKKHSHSH